MVPAAILHWGWLAVLCTQLSAVNLMLVLFNLLPSFPMDGGRVLRALLGMKLDYVNATRIAATVGHALALGFGFLGLFGNPFLVFIALFVWIGAAQEASLVQMKSALGGIPVEQVMITDYRTLGLGDPLGRAVDLTLATSQKDFPVLDGGRLVGILTQPELLKALDQHGRELPVAEVMEREFRTAEVSEMMEPVFLRLQECACRTIPVLAGGQLRGLVTMDNVGELVSIRTALRK